MSTAARPISVLSFVLSVVLTLLVVGLAYWLWQDVKPLLRPLKGDWWRLLKDVQILTNVLGIFALVTVAGFVFDKAGAQSILTRLIMLAVLLVIIGSLVRYGSFFEKQIEPHLASYGFERPAFLTVKK